MRLEILVTETRDITLSRQRKQRRWSDCAGWSAPLLFAYDIRYVFSWPGSCKTTGCQLTPKFFKVYNRSWDLNSVRYVQLELTTIFEPPHDKTQQNGMCAQRRLRSAWSSAQSDQSSLSAWRKLGSLATHWAHNEDWSDWVDAQADLNLRWAQSFCWFCCEAAHFINFRVSKSVFFCYQSERSRVCVNIITGEEKIFWLDMTGYRTNDPLHAKPTLCHVAIKASLYSKQGCASVLYTYTLWHSSPLHWNMSTVQSKVFSLHEHFNEALH